MKSFKKMLWAVPGYALFLAVLFLYPAVSKAVTPIQQANKTIFGPNVYIFSPSMPDSAIQNIASSVYSDQKTNQFGAERKALLFKPGSYDLNIKVGYYTSVAGLGRNPGDVSINGGGVNVSAQWNDGNALVNFWRSVENLTINPSDGITRWAVSQAAPMRRVHVKGQLQLFDFNPHGGAGYGSGGFLADSVVDTIVIPASQQQWFSRNNKYGVWTNGNWNMVFVGDKHPPSGQFPPYTIVKKTPIIKNKPYLYVTDTGKYRVFVPALQKDTQGVSWLNGPTPGKSIPIDRFYIAKPDKSNAASINAALNQGKSLIFTPGVYHLQGTIQITKPNTVVLGMGIATLSADNGQTVMSVADVGGITISGLLFDAGAKSSPSLLKVGPADSSADHSANPTSLHDLFFRVGGSHVGKAKTSLQINSNGVIGDDFWVWRADHGKGVGWDINTAANGIVVNGDNVTLYGLFVEHYQKYQTVWNGNNGRTYFYQSEDPYDPPNQSAWKSHHGTVNGYASYKVADSVTSHHAFGLGVYAYLRDAPVKQQSAIEMPPVKGIVIHHAVTIWLNGKKGSQITHVINNTGGRVYATSPAGARRQIVTIFRGQKDRPHHK
jgi:hypothetical protein